MIETFSFFFLRHGYILLSLRLTRTGLYIRCDSQGMSDYPPNCLGPPALGDVVKFIPSQSCHMGQGTATGFNTKTLQLHPFWGGPLRDVEEPSWPELKRCVTVGLAGTRALLRDLPCCCFYSLTFGGHHSASK